MDIKETIKNTFVGKLAISYLHCLECKILPAFINDEEAVKLFYYKNTGRKIDLSNPRSFSEKINWYKLNSRDPLMQQCADKIAVREYIKSKGYGDCLNEIYAIYKKVSEINISALPERFVLKASHGSQMSIIVKDKKSINWFEEKLLMRSWLHRDIYWFGREWVYKNIPRRIVAEKYLEDETGELRDFKFFCFHSAPEILQVDFGRYGNQHFRNYYSIESKKQLLLKDNENLPDKPVKIEELFQDEKLFYEAIKMAADLSKPFEQVRVDLYIVNGKIFFGEMTFFDAAGTTIFSPDEWNERFSEKWKIERR